MSFFYKKIVGLQTAHTMPYQLVVVNGHHVLGEYLDLVPTDNSYQVILEAPLI